MGTKGYNSINKTCILYLTIGFILLVKLLNGQDKKSIFFSDIDGLPSNIVYCTDKDKHGYLWIGTTNGIAKYNCIEFTTYKNLDGNTIFSILVDSKNQVWAATSTTLYRYNRLTDSFLAQCQAYIQKIREDKNGDIYFSTLNTIERFSKHNNEIVLHKNGITDFCFNDEGLWYCTDFSGAILLSRESSFKEIKEAILPGQSISTIKSLNKVVFLGTKSGNLFIRNLPKNLKQINLPNHYLIKSINKIDNKVWVATDGNGILILNKQLRFEKKIDHSSNNIPQLSSNSIYNIFQDESQTIWISSYGAGLTCILLTNPLFKNLSPINGNKNSLVANEGVFARSKNEQLFLGTNYGLSVYNENIETFQNLSLNKLKTDLNGFKVLGICTDNENNIWVGTYDGLLGKYNSNFELLKTFSPSSSNSEEMQQIILMHNYNNENLLIATQYPNRSLLNLNLNNKSISPIGFPKGKSTIFQFEINALRENQKGEIIALISDKGLFKVNVKQNTLEQIAIEATKYIKYWITDFYFDKYNGIWFTTNDGLYYSKQNGKEFKHWTVNDGLPTNSLVRVEATNNRFLWISTISGICKFDRVSNEVLTYNYNDGLAANEFSQRASTITSNGRIIFGSATGFTIINPEVKNSLTKPAEVIISDISFQNQSIKSYKSISYLSKPIEETTHISLPYNKNSFTIEFFTRNDVVPNISTYKYRMLGLENDWINLGKTNKTTYTNLKPGNYEFEVISTNKLNLGEQMPTKLAITILTPWFLSWYSYVLYFLIIFGLLTLIIFAYINRINYKKEVEISTIKIQSEKEITENKLAFFTNISHDLKTPLTLIDAPVHDLLNSPNLNTEDKNKLHVIRRNSKRLYKLISDLVDFRRLTQKQIPLRVQETDISPLLDNIFNAFHIECQNKSVELILKNEVQNKVFVDGNKIEKILWNLLSNAIKYTNENGHIYIEAKEIPINNNNNKYIELKVKDTGIGIKEDELQNIFNRFYQIPETTNETNKGTGIGLSIVKDLVEIHYGEINVESKVGLGTVFTIKLPAYKEKYNKSQILTNDEKKDFFTDNEFKSLESENNDSNAIKKYSKPVLLIIEDNIELNEYLFNHFEKEYKVYQAFDGNEGLSFALNNNIDIIITDVSMPKMNGYEFCKQIRLKIELSHIPLIMLTANAAVEQQIQGLSLGADAYITKPFDINLLDTSIQTILNNRKKIRNKLLGNDQNPTKKEVIPTQDEEFINEVKQFIYDNLSNTELKVDTIANNFSLSRVHLNRKIKALTGKTTIQLINSIRLNNAYKLIREGLRVSEAAYKTGFNDPNYFTICFKKEFGENPSKLT